MLKEENTQTFRGCSIIFSGPLKKRKHPQNVWFFSFSTCILKNFGIHSIWRHCGLHVVFITLDLRSVGLGSSMPPFQDPNSPFSMTACFTCPSAHLHILSYVLCKKLNIAETGRKDASNQKFAIENNLANHSSQNVSLRQHRKLQKKVEQNSS